MPISKLGQRRQVVIPKEICDALGLQEGDSLEVTSAEGKVIITPKQLGDAAEVLTPAQKAVIEARLAEAEEDLKAGRVSGPFATVDQLKRHLNARR
jgi:AbrB family looped-hinge helix DNA binding protein